MAPAAPDEATPVCLGAQPPSESARPAAPAAGEGEGVRLRRGVRTGDFLRAGEGHPCPDGLSLPAEGQRPETVAGGFQVGQKKELTNWEQVSTGGQKLSCP